MFSHFLGHEISVFLECLEAILPQSNIAIQCNGSFLEYQQDAEQDSGKSEDGTKEQHRAAQSLRSETTQAKWPQCNDCKSSSPIPILTPGSTLRLCQPLTKCSLLPSCYTTTSWKYHKNGLVWHYTSLTDIRAQKAEMSLYFDGDCLTKIWPTPERAELDKQSVCVIHIHWLIAKCTLSWALAAWTSCFVLQVTKWEHRREVLLAFSPQKLIVKSTLVLKIVCLKGGVQILQIPFQVQDPLYCSGSSGSETGCGVGSWGSVYSNCGYTVDLMRKRGFVFVTTVSFCLLYVQWWLVSRCLRDCQTWHLCLSAEHLVVSETGVAWLSRA